MDTATDWLPETLPNTPAPKGKKRTQLQVVIGAEASWLQTYLIPTDVYICPSEVKRARAK